MNLQWYTFYCARPPIELAHPYTHTHWGDWACLYIAMEAWTNLATQATAANSAPFFLPFMCAEGAIHVADASCDVSLVWHHLSVQYWAMVGHWVRCLLHVQSKLSGLALTAGTDVCVRTCMHVCRLCTLHFGGHMTFLVTWRLSCYGKSLTAMTATVGAGMTAKVACVYMSTWSLRHQVWQYSMTFCFRLPML